MQLWGGELQDTRKAPLGSCVSIKRGLAQALPLPPGLTFVPHCLPPAWGNGDSTSAPKMEERGDAASVLVAQVQEAGGTSSGGEAAREMRLQSGRSERLASFSCGGNGGAHGCVARGAFCTCSCIWRFQRKECTEPWYSFLFFSFSHHPCSSHLPPSNTIPVSSTIFPMLRL